MTTVVDTTVLIDHLRGDERAHRRLAGLSDGRERVVGSVLTLVEVLAGVRRGEEAGTARLLGTIEWIPVDEPIARRAGELAREYLPAYPGVDTVDFVIAATAEQLHATLLTANVRHFPMFPGLSNSYA
ncbi:MAG: type II toxin-antitoxin system VapC family toxin [Dehalococcoidia bacterium]